MMNTTAPVLVSTGTGFAQRPQAKSPTTATSTAKPPTRHGHETAPGAYAGMRRDGRTSLTPPLSAEHSRSAARRARPNDGALPSPSFHSAPTAPRQLHRVVRRLVRSPHAPSQLALPCLPGLASHLDHHPALQDRTAVRQPCHRVTRTPLSPQGVSTVGKRSAGSAPSASLESEAVHSPGLVEARPASGQHAPAVPLRLGGAMATMRRPLLARSSSERYPTSGNVISSRVASAYFPHSPALVRLTLELSCEAPKFTGLRQLQLLVRPRRLQAYRCTWVRTRPVPHEGHDPRSPHQLSLTTVRTSDSCGRW